MIQDLSLSLRALLTLGGTEFKELSAANVAFDRPADSFNPSQPTVSLYLYDVRENRELRSSEPEVRIVNGRASINRAPLRILCTYLVTAWPGNVTGDDHALNEQLLLSQTLLVLSRYPKIPATYLKGSLAGQIPALPMITAQAEGLPNPSEFWTALSNRLRPSLSIGVTLTLQPMASTDGPLVATSEIRLSHDGTPAFDLFSIGGTVVDATNAPLPGVDLSLPKLSVRTRSGPDGRYVFANLAAGDHALHLQKDTLSRDVTLRVPAPKATGYDVKLA